MSRKIQDAELNVSKALPAADANNTTDSIDLGAATPWPTTETIGVDLSVPATPDLVEAKTITFTLEESADNSSFAAIAELATLVVTGAALAAGGPAATRTIYLPPSVKRYVRAKAAVLADGGDNTGVSYSLGLRF